MRKYTNSVKSYLKKWLPWVFVASAKSVRSILTDAQYCARNEFNGRAPGNLAIARGRTSIVTSGGLSGLNVASGGKMADKV